MILVSLKMILRTSWLILSLLIVNRRELIEERWTEKGKKFYFFTSMNFDVHISSKLL